MHAPVKVALSCLGVLSLAGTRCLSPQLLNLHPQPAWNTKAASSLLPWLPLPRQHLQMPKPFRSGGHAQGTPTLREAGQHSLSVPEQLLMVPDDTSPKMTLEEGLEESFSPCLWASVVRARVRVCE